MKQAQRRARTVGLDKPCSKCGAPIHHTYVGPVDGVCGRCTDRGRRKRVRTRRVGRIGGAGSAPRRRGKAVSILLVAVAMVVGAAAVVFALDLFLG